MNISCLRAGDCLLADRLRKADLTQEKLSEITGIAPSSISEYVKGEHKMSLSTAYTIAHALNCNIEELYTWKSVRRKQR